MKLNVSVPTPTVELTPGKWTAVLRSDGSVAALFDSATDAAAFVDFHYPGLRLVSVVVPA